MENNFLHAIISVKARMLRWCYMNEHKRAQVGLVVPRDTNPAHMEKNLMLEKHLPVKMLQSLVQGTLKEINQLWGICSCWVTVIHLRNVSQNPGVLSLWLRPTACWGADKGKTAFLLAS